MNVRITIRGRQYTLRTDEPEEDLTAIAAYVDGKMAELSRSSFDEYTIALLAALNIAQEFHRFRKQMSERLEGVDREMAAISAILEAALPEEALGDELLPVSDDDLGDPDTEQ
ncbi:MAG: cell division protein ZapA [Deltaproteobacteria bacterium]|nr:cell division protein ZapA [Deltaproteobacteria bacterium]